MSRLLRVRFSMEGLGAEKLLNAARKQGVSLRARRTAGRGMTLECAARDYEVLAGLAKERGFAVGPAQGVGLLRWLHMLNRRRGLAAGALIAAALMGYSLGFVWQVRIEDAGAYLGEVRLFLAEQGVRPGVRRSTIDLASLREKLEWRLPQVKWVQTGWAGTALVVRIVEGVAPPGIETAGAPGDVVADRDGILWRLTTFAGTPMCREGELVKAGQVLIRGAEQGPDGTERPVKARGVALARVWVQTKIQTSLGETQSVPTGRAYGRLVLKTPWLALALGPEPDYLTWDVDVQETAVGGAWAPLWLRRETYWEAALEKVVRPAQETAQEAEKVALLALDRATIGQEVIDKWTDYSMIDRDIIMVTATAEIRCDIGRYQKHP